MRGWEGEGERSQKERTVEGRVVREVDQLSELVPSPTRLDSSVIQIKNSLRRKVSHFFVELFAQIILLFN